MEDGSTLTLATIATWLADFSTGVVNATRPFNMLPRSILRFAGLPWTYELSGLTLRHSLFPIKSSQLKPQQNLSSFLIQPENNIEATDLALENSFQKLGEVESPSVSTQPVFSRMIQLPRFLAKAQAKLPPTIPRRLVSIRQPQRLTGLAFVSKARELPNRKIPTNSSADLVHPRQTIPQDALSSELASPEWKEDDTIHYQNASSQPLIETSRPPDPHADPAIEGSTPLSSSVTSLLLDRVTAIGDAQTADNGSGIASKRRSGSEAESPKSPKPNLPLSQEGSKVESHAQSLLHSTLVNALRLLHLRHERQPALLPSRNSVQSRFGPSTPASNQGTILSKVVASQPKMILEPSAITSLSNPNIGPRPHPDPTSQTPNSTLTLGNDSLPESPAGGTDTVERSTDALGPSALLMTSARLVGSGFFYPNVAHLRYLMAKGESRPPQPNKFTDRELSVRPASRALEDLLMVHSDLESSQTRLGFNSVKETRSASPPRFDLPTLKGTSSGRPVLGVESQVSGEGLKVTLPSLTVEEVPYRWPTETKALQTLSSIELSSSVIENSTISQELEDAEDEETQGLRLKISRILAEEARRYFAGD